MRADWQLVIGLEVHCELRTATKLFCGCPNVFGDEPNTNVCPNCLGLPGSLPVLNQRAVELAMAIGTALHCDIRPSTFHRKNYFYPDQAKDYQISQYDEPLNVDGHLDLPDGFRVGIERAHMEEDTGKTTHAGASGPHPRRRLLAGRLQPLRRAAGGDRERARHADAGPGPGLRDRAAGHPGGVRRLRRQDGGGFDAGRRQRLGPPLGRTTRSAPAARSRTSTRSARSAGPSSTRRSARSPSSSPASRSSSRPATGTRARAAPRRCAPRRTPTTTGTSWSPTWCRWCPTPSGSGRWPTPSG